MSSQDMEREDVLQNGDIYVGNFSGPIPHGFGKYIWSDGAIYQGEWDNGKMTGKGHMQWPSGSTYEGDFRGGFLDGFGTFKVDGSVYEGSWRMNKQHGMGAKVYANSDIYKGQWDEGVQSGFGSYKWVNGNVYSGNWEAGQMSGRGVMMWTNGDHFDGNWLNGLAHGKGCYCYVDGACYIGSWCRGIKDGQGVFYQPGSRIPSNLEVSEYITHVYSRDDAVASHSSGSFEELKNRLLFLLRSNFRKWNLGSFLGRSGHISNGTETVSDDNSKKLLQQEWSDSSLSLEEGQHDSASEIFLIFEREYIQGVLIMEKPRRQDLETMKNSNWTTQGKGPVGTIYKGHKSYYLMLNLQLGIRYTVGKITPVPLREVRSNDFGPRARIRMYFPCEGSQYTPPHYGVNFFWKDYCPMVFRNLREMFNIDAADYMMSICGGDGTLKELSSPGKSGSIFYLSQDERFVIKTLRKGELKVLLRMLPSYYTHVRAYDNTLITKFFGVHRIALPGGRKVRFVVMGNMFRTELRIHRRYDLKGSTTGRFTKKQNISENTTLKDLDLEYVFYLEKSWRESLLRQISIDCMFLESQSIIDYSMLLGVHFRAPDHLKAFSSHQGTTGTVDISESISTMDNNAPIHFDDTTCKKGFLLVAHEPSSASMVSGSHIRGSMVRASEAGDEEVDIVLPGTGRLRVQLGVNMPAQARKKHQDKTRNTELESADLFEVYDVVLYLGIIDILQEYNLAKRIEHAAKSLKFDPLSISAVEPRLYSKRFISFLERVFPPKGSE